MLVYWVAAMDYILWQDWTISSGRIEYNQHISNSTTGFIEDAPPSLEKRSLRLPPGQPEGAHEKRRI
jgi:hypothetical protein